MFMKIKFDAGKAAEQGLEESPGVRESEGHILDALKEEGRKEP